jgi:hypothetical protein
MSIAYGLDIKPKNDPYIQTAERGVHPLVAAAVPGAFLVDMIPLLKYVPEWMPGAGFQKKAREWGKLALTMVDIPFEAAKKLIVSPFLGIVTGFRTPHVNLLNSLGGRKGKAFVYFVQYAESIREKR